jgi:hypothetical protein
MLAWRHAGMIPDPGTRECCETCWHGGMLE